jgi:hypothetical protein
MSASAGSLLSARMSVDRLKCWFTEFLVSDVVGGGGGGGGRKQHVLCT